MQADPFAKYDPEILNIVRNYRLLDDNFMAKVFEDKACIELVLRIIMQVPTLMVERHHVQECLNNIQGKSVRYDVWAVDEDGTQYNIEVQRADAGAISKRARYNSSVLDSNVLQSGDTYEKLPKTYVIFITEHDVFGKGQLRYNIDRMYFVDKAQRYEPFGDDAHIIYVNAAYHDMSTELGRLMSDFREKETEKMYFQTLKERVKLFKNEPEGGEIMCKAIEELLERACQEASQEAKVTERRALTIELLRDGDITMEVACAKLGMSKDEVQDLLDAPEK